MKKILITALLLAGITATAQVKVGNDPTNLATDANLQVEATNGSQFFIHRTSGNVGIGTSAPGNKLVVEVTGDDRIAISSSVNQNVGFAISKNVSGGSNNASWQFYNPGTTTDLRIYSGAVGDVVNINAAGNFGIGTIVPNAKLTVQRGTDNGGYGDVATFYSNLGDLGGKISTNSDGYMRFGTVTNHGLSFITNNTDRIFVAPSGLVGIGNANPNGALDVNGNVVLDYIGSSHTHIRFGHDAHDMIITDNTAAKTYGGGYFFRVTNSSGSAIEAIQIDENGRIGMGATPTSKLQVTGLPGYATDGDAGAAGLTAGAFYQTAGHATLPNGVIMVKQ